MGGEGDRDGEGDHGDEGTPGDQRQRAGAHGPVSPVPDRREAALWGVVGGLSFLVLVQGYALLTEASVGVPVLAGGALAVGAAAALASRALGAVLAKRRV